jgi:hypothetical protein
MPIRRFRRIEDMERPNWRQPGDPELYAAIKMLWDFGRRTATRRFPPGVYRHASIEALNAQTRAWHAEPSRHITDPASEQSREPS